MQQLSPMRTRPSLLAFGAIAFVALLIGLSLGLSMGSRSPTSATTPTASQSAAGHTPSVAPTRSATSPPARTPAPAPTLVPCGLPGALGPAPAAAPAVAPVIEGDNAVSMLFTSHLSHRGLGSDDAVISDNPNGDWAVGLWFVAAGSREARLLVATTSGMVLPLALSPDGTLAAIWWLPVRRHRAEAACEGGIYTMSTVSGASRLVLRGDWTIQAGESDEGSGGAGLFWTDPWTAGSEPRTYRVPEVAISTDGRLAVLHESRIAIYGRDQTEPSRVHIGECSDWAWSPVGATFVAGCDDMTTAWVVDAAEGRAPESLPLPWLHDEAIRTGWGYIVSPTIGFTGDGKLRAAGFYGFATGCEAPGPCNIPAPAFVVATIDAGTGKASSVRTGTIDFLAGEVTRMSATATWIYVADYDEGARTVVAATGVVSNAARLDMIVGAAIDGSALYGLREDEAGGRVIVSALDAAGTAREVATIQWPDGSIATDPVIATIGLVVVRPPS